MAAARDDGVEDDVDDVLARAQPGRRDRLGDRDRAFEVRAVRPHSSASSRGSATSSVSPSSTPPPGSSQYEWSPFACCSSRTASPRRRAPPRGCGGALTPRTHRRRPEPALGPLRRRQVGRLDHLHRGHRQDHQLGDAVARPDVERLLGVGVQEHDHELSAVAAVDQAGRVQHGDAVAGREAGAGLDEPRVAGGDRDRQAGRDRAPPPGASTTSSTLARSRPASPS